MWLELELEPQELQLLLQGNINAAKMFYNESKFNKYVSNIKQTWTIVKKRRPT